MVTQEYLDSVDDKLAQYCAGGYALGLIGEANIRHMLERFPDFVQRQRVYRLGDIACLRFGIATDYDEAGEATLEAILEALDGLEDYPVIDEGTFDALLKELEVEDVERIASENNVSTQRVWEAVNELGGYWEWEQDYVFLAGVGDAYGTSEELVVARALELGNSWDAHYGYSDEAQYHSPESCWYCERAKVA